MSLLYFRHQTLAVSITIMWRAVRVPLLKSHLTRASTIALRTIIRSLVALAWTTSRCPGRGGLERWDQKGLALAGLIVVPTYINSVWPSVSLKLSVPSGLLTF